MELEFKKPKIRLGETFETGYYFKGDFLSRYKIEAIKILRKKVEHLSYDKRNETDEWKVIHKEYLKSVEATKKIYESKKPYWDKLNKQTMKRKILVLNDKIGNIIEKKNDSNKLYDEKISNIQKEINQIKDFLAKGK